jgi:hypothetical protein
MFLTQQQQPPPQHQKEEDEEEEEGEEIRTSLIGYCSFCAVRCLIRTRRKKVLLNKFTQIQFTFFRNW